MKSILIILMALGLPFSVAYGLDISDDGLESAQAMGTPGHIVIITDEVPLPAEPDYTCDLRMQVGGLDFGDLDGDGDPDLAVGCYYSQAYPPFNDWRNFILINIDGQLEADPSWWSSDERSTTDVKWADFNGDSYLDLFACNGDFSFDPSVIYFGSADGLSETPGWVVDDNTWTLYAAPFDYDQDGDIDVATANEGVSPDPYRPIYIYQNTGDGLPMVPTWESADEMITETLDWGDMDGDGWYELAASKWSGFESGVYGNNEGEITAYPIWATDSTGSQKGIGWADVDDDNYPELAIGGTGPTVLYDNEYGHLGPYPIWNSVNSYHGCQDLKWGDIDGDGDPDLATIHFSTGRVRLYLNIDGVLENEPSWVYDASGAGTALAFADINGDNMLDLAVGQSGEPSVMIFLNTNATSVENENPLPNVFSLKQNFPNPFNASTTIEFQLANKSQVKLTIYDLLGSKVATLIHATLPAGEHSINWNAADLSSGIYFYRLTSGDGVETRRMTLLK